jgi:hypothetical protein
MRTTHAVRILIAVVMVATTSAAADREWQTGTWAQVGVARTPYVGDPVHERMPPGFNKPQMTEVGAYTIETVDRRYFLQSMVPIRSDALDFQVKVGSTVRFAIEKKTAYIKLETGEHRLLVVKTERKKS